MNKSSAIHKIRALFVGNNVPVNDANTVAVQSAERTLIIVRWFAVIFGLVQVHTYYLPYPDNLKAAGFGVVAVLAIGNIAIWLAHWLAQAPKRVRQLSIASLGFDVVITFAFVSIYTFDVDTAIFILIFILPLEGAMKFQRRGALFVMAVAAALYTLREIIGARVYDYDLVPASISFRMGIGFMIAAVAGAMSARYEREHRRVKALYYQELEVAKALRTLDENKNTFLTAVSHELRTPLTSVLGFALTLQSTGNELTPQHRAMLDHITVQSQRLEKLLSDLLDLQQTITSPVEHTKCDLAEVVNAALSGISPLIANRVVVAHLDSVLLDIDQPKIERVVENLVLNADKYTPAGTEIHVSVHGNESGALIVVDDEGAGVPDVLKQTIFEPFQHGNQRSYHAPGAGIGLSLVSRFTEMHGGRAWVEDRPGGGASFRVFLPYSNGANHG